MAYAKEEEAGRIPVVCLSIQDSVRWLPKGRYGQSRVPRGLRTCTAGTRQVLEEAVGLEARLEALHAFLWAMESP